MFEGMRFGIDAFGMAAKSAGDQKKKKKPEPFVGELFT